MNPIARFLPLAFLADTLRELGAAQRRTGRAVSRLHAPGCARFLPGEAVTSISFARLVSRQFDWLVTVDPHLHRWHALSDIYTIPAVALQAAPLLAAWVRANVRNPVLIGPDEESEQWVSGVAGAAGCAFLVLQKQRKGDRDVIGQQPVRARLGRSHAGAGGRHHLFRPDNGCDGQAVPRGRLCYRPSVWASTASSHRMRVATLQQAGAGLWSRRIPLRIPAMPSTSRPCWRRL